MPHHSKEHGYKKQKHKKKRHRQRHSSTDESSSESCDRSDSSLSTGSEKIDVVSARSHKECHRKHKRRKSQRGADSDCREEHRHSDLVHLSRSKSKHESFVARGLSGGKHLDKHVLSKHGHVDKKCRARHKHDEDKCDSESSSSTGEADIEEDLFFRDDSKQKPLRSFPDEAVQGVKSRKKGAGSSDNKYKSLSDKEFDFTRYKQSLSKIFFRDTHFSKISER